MAGRLLVSAERTGLKRTIKDYLRDNFYGGILPGEYADQAPGAMDPSWSLSVNAYRNWSAPRGLCC
ncbi:MAG TPA: hypothetical protein VE197_06875 [Mycobacterium sp.]|nr:hypothetical protein [Mycobacterium sp.]